MNIDTLIAFRDEIEKQATPGLARVGRIVAPVLVGSGVGAAAGALGAGEDNRLSGALAGGVAGGVLGGGGALTARALQDTRLLSQAPLTAGQTVLETARRAGTGMARFARRQWHGLTGAYADPLKTGIQSSAMAAEKEKLLNARFRAKEKKISDPSQLSAARRAHDEEIKALREAGAEGDKDLQAGITSIPGLARGLADSKKRKQVLERIFHANTGGKLLSMGGAFGVALPTALSAYDLSRGDESAVGGHSIPQKLVNAGANVGVGALTAGLPMGSQMLVTSAVEGLGQKLVSPRWSRRPGLAEAVQSVDPYVQPVGGVR